MTPRKHKRSESPRCKLDAVDLRSIAVQIILQGLALAVLFGGQVLMQNFGDQIDERDTMAGAVAVSVLYSIMHACRRFLRDNTGH